MTREEKMRFYHSQAWRRMSERILIRDHIIDQIHSLGDSKYVELLYLKYVGRRENGGKIHYFRLEEIACVMKKSNGLPYSYEHIRILHGEALKRFAEINSLK